MPKSISFKPLKVGGRVVAAEWNRLIRTVSQLVSDSDQGTSHRLPKFRLLRVSGQIGADQSSESADYHRLGTVQWYNGTANAWQDTNPSNIIRTLSDPYDLVYDDDQLLVAWYFEQAGLYIPINPITVRHAVTCRDDSNRYPSHRDGADTYPIKFVHLSYTEAISNRGHTMYHLDDDAGQDDFVHNIVDPALAFIPVGTLIQVYHVQDRWFTQVCCDDSADSSASGSDSSFSSSSQSASASSRGSSVSLSSGGSSDSSSRGSSASSRGSSESSSGESSASSMSSGGSSASSNLSSASSDLSELSSRGSSLSVSDQSSGYCESVTLVSSLSFNSTSCVLSYCTRQLCFPDSLGVIISGERC